MDPVEIRLKNALKDGDTMGVGTASPSRVTVTQCIEAAVEKFDWANSNIKTGSASHLKRGKGFAAGFKNIGFSFGYQENCWAKIELRGKADIDEVILYHASAEVGQGTHTVMTQMAAEAVGVPFEKVKLVASDTAMTGTSGSVSARPRSERFLNVRLASGWSFSSNGEAGHVTLADVDEIFESHLLGGVAVERLRLPPARKPE